MPRTSSEKLAAALRANLKRRKAHKTPERPVEAPDIIRVTGPGNPEKAPSQPGEKAKTPPSTKG